ncbi:MAG: mechanosensitive ion channel family protein [Nitrososphaerota archaeon]|jgi:small-conductance mechanosensitive channel|nr:mechanosensitive ion channel family protein [Nitrososphaerota archaeon]
MSAVDPSPINQVNAFLGIPINHLITLLLIVVIAIIIERLITKYLTYFSKKTKLEPNTANKLTLIFRILILIGALLAISRDGLSTEFLISASAISGAALGFASQKTIGDCCIDY